MTTYTDHPPAMKTLRIIVMAALAAVAISAAAGIWFWIADPAEGTTLHDSLGATAAFSGLAAGALFAGAAIYAQVKNLWQYMPSWIRVVVMTFVIVGLIISIMNWIQT